MEESVPNESKGHLSGIPFLYFFTEITDRQKASASESLFGGETPLCHACLQWANHLTRTKLVT